MLKRRRHPAPAARETMPLYRTKFLGVGEREIRVVASDATPDRMGDILEPYGAILGNYRRNPIVLAQHDPNQPIARCSHIAVENNQLVALLEFPRAGMNARSDEYLNLLKAGVIGAVSVGFLPLEWQPIKDAGLRFTSWECLEISCVSVPANPAALVVERRLRRGSDETPIGTCGRPVGGDCGMKDVAECSIHGWGGVGAGTADDNPEKAVHLRRAAAIRRRMQLAPVSITARDRGDLAAAIRAGHGLARRVDPRLLVADAAFRMGAA